MLDAIDAGFAGEAVKDRLRQALNRW